MARAERGSSPHTRGTRAVCGSNPWLTSVHPRIRGERMAKATGGNDPAGSSPHTRGTRVRGTLDAEAGRFIPAYAGNAFFMNSATWIRAVHPRIRGERLRPASSVTVACGSSPHTRGTPRACTGPQPEASVHPRIRGERSPVRYEICPPSGSSPHTRGTPVCRYHQVGVPRFIPAYAGNAFRNIHGSSLTPVHPRIRGERAGLSLGKPGAGGSSPHTRGTPRERPTVPRLHRFIPAYAGNAERGPHVCARPPVHPRIRGERFSVFRRTVWAVGSSPHTRGTRYMQQV